MCNDPNSPNPAAFCCMRGWAIAFIVFGCFEVLGSLNNIQGMIRGGSCYVCPDSTVDWEKEAGHECSVDLMWKGETSCLEAEYDKAFCTPLKATLNTQTDCEAAKGEWTAFTCGERARWWARSSIGASNDCSVAQASPTMQACCIAGDAPPGNRAAFNLFFLLILGGLKITAGSLLSCCCGAPSEGRMKAVLGVMSLVCLMDLVLVILTVVSLGSVSNNECVPPCRRAARGRASPRPHMVSRDVSCSPPRVCRSALATYRDPRTYCIVYRVCAWWWCADRYSDARFRQWASIFLLANIGGRVVNILFDLTYIGMTKRASSAGIGKEGDTPAI